MAGTDNKKAVLAYLLDNCNLKNKSNSLDRLYELVTDEYEEASNEVREAYRQLTAHEYWEVIRKLAVEGKKQSVEG